MRAEIITIGDELLLGDTIDTNSAFISSRLDSLGVTINRIVTIGDEKEDILDSLNAALSRSELVLITGGLGPTHDDITKHTLTEYFGGELELDEEVEKDVTRRLEGFGRKMNELHRSQAFVPNVAKIIRNVKGTAPGLHFERNGAHVISMPGVPSEMKKMIEDYVVPLLQESKNGRIRSHRYLKAFGIPEADLARDLKEVINSLDKRVKLAFLPNPGHVKLRISVQGDNQDEVNAVISNAENKLVSVASDYIYGFDRDTLEGSVAKLLSESGKTVSTAESCTGGTLASKFTSIHGSSEYFKGSIVAYDNEVKINQLNVNSQDIEKHGAVSEQVVEQMAKGIRNLIGTDYALASSGIAGPDGGTEEKPVGTIWIALDSEKATISKRLKLGFGRKTNISLTSDYMLELLRKELLSEI